MARKKKAPVPDMTPEEEARLDQRIKHRITYEKLKASEPREIWVWLAVLQEPFKKDEAKDVLIERLMPLLIGKANYANLLAAIAAEQKEAAERGEEPPPPPVEPMKRGSRVSRGERIRIARI